MVGGPPVVLRGLAVACPDVGGRDGGVDEDLDPVVPDADHVDGAAVDQDFEEVPGEAPTDAERLAGVGHGLREPGGGYGGHGAAGVVLEAGGEHGGAAERGNEGVRLEGAGAAGTGTGCASGERHDPYGKRGVSCVQRDQGHTASSTTVDTASPATRASRTSRSRAFGLISTPRRPPSPARPGTTRGHDLRRGPPRYRGPAPTTSAGRLGSGSAILGSRARRGTHGTCRAARPPAHGSRGPHVSHR